MVFMNGMGPVCGKPCQEQLGFCFRKKQPYFHPLGFDMWGMMFIGMGLMKLGVLSGGYPVRFYLALLLAGYGLGFSINSYTAWLITHSEFDPVVHHFSQLFYPPPVCWWQPGIWPCF
jgi:hypothetical protein